MFCYLKNYYTSLRMMILDDTTTKTKMQLKKTPFNSNLNMTLSTNTNNARIQLMPNTK